MRVQAVSCTDCDASVTRTKVRVTGGPKKERETLSRQLSRDPSRVKALDHAVARAGLYRLRLSDRAVMDAQPAHPRLGEPGNVPRPGGVTPQPVVHHGHGQH